MREALRTIWTTRDWSWQHRQGTLSVSSGSGTAELPDDFREMHSWQLKDEDEETVLTLTRSSRRWLRARQEYDSDDEGAPELGVIMRDTSDSANFIYKVYLVPPKSDDDYSFPFIYLPICPIDLDDTHNDYKADSDAIPMPQPFHEGWRLLARRKVQAVYGSPETAKVAAAEYREWMLTAIDENDEAITDRPDLIEDGYDDVGSLLSDASRARPDPWRVLPNIT